MFLQSAFNGASSSIAYTASKAALDTMTSSLAPLIRVNAVCPRYGHAMVVNGVGQEAADRLRDMVEAAVPLRVASRPEDSAEIVRFLADPGSRHMTGSLVPVDDGFRLLEPIAPTDARRD